MAITRTPMVDDDGSGTTGTIINNAWKQELYGQIDAALAASPGAVVTTGSWTPALRSASGSGQTYADRNGQWIRVGVTGAGLVVVTGFLSLSNKGTMAGGLEIDGWPFPFPALFVSLSVGNAYGLASAWASLLGMSVGGRITLYGFPAAGATAAVQLTAADLTNTATFMFQTAYLTP